MAAAPQATASEVCGAHYVIASGDTLGKIAKRCGHSVRDIIQANAISDASRLRIGQRLRMPGTVEGANTEQTVTTMTTIKGRVFNGRWCALIETPDGEIYGLTSPTVAFGSGDVVAVTGKIVPGRGCRQERTIVVSDLTEIAAN